jgi:protein-S-isoprenylcysteine O-methyltransferase Ste14
MYELPDVSIAQRLTLAVVIGVWLAMAVWLLSGVGLPVVSARLGWVWRPGDPIRRASLAIALSIYYIRLLFTWFAFLKRGMTWGEALTIAPWLLCIYLLMAIAGGTNQTTLGVTGYFGLILFVIGSWMNTYSEYARGAWKERSENRGKLYTVGLFSFVRHPNYLGDLISFSGLCLISGRWITAPIPAIMLAGFIFVNIPALDSHLHKRYGKTFDEYAKRTPKLIPFIY